MCWKAFVLTLSVCAALALPAPLAMAAAETEVAAEPSRGWIRTGGPIGGLGYDIRMRPSDPSRMYVTDAYAGVFRSEDYGRTWAPSNAGIAARVGASGEAIPVFCLTVDPNRPDTIWIGTQSVRGVYRSDDGGKLWLEKVRGIVEPQGVTFRGFTVDPRDSDIVYGAAEISSHTWAGTERRGREFDLVKGVVYKTIDGGERWTAVWRGDNLARYIWLDPRNPDVVYVSTGIFDREAANSDPVLGKPGGVGIIKSTDGGRTWNPVSSGMNNLYVGSLFMHPMDPDILLAGTGNNSYRQGAGVYLSTNGGASWKWTLMGDVITAVEFSVSNPKIAYAGSLGSVSRSVDGGLTWQRMTSRGFWGPPEVVAGCPIDFQIDPINPNRLFANNYGGGNFLSTDAGRTWTVASQGYTGAQVRAVAVDPVCAGRAYAAARSGVFRTVTGGSAWIGAGGPPASLTECNAIAVDPVGGSHLLAGAGVMLFNSYDGGASWSATADVRWGLGWRAVAFAPSDPRVVYAGTGGYYTSGVFANELAGAGVFVSADGGLTWRRPASSIATANVAALAVDPVKPERVFAASSNLGIFRSMDGGRTWRVLGDGLPENPPTALSIAIDPLHTNILLAGFEDAGVYRSVDGGETWQGPSPGLHPEAIVTSIVFSRQDPSVVYAADLRSGVFRSADGGLTWAPFGQNLDFRAINALAMSSDGEHLYAASEGRGMYRLDLSGIPPVKYKVAPPASLTRPWPNLTSVPRSKTFYVSGYVRPGHATTGALQCEKYSAGRWRGVSAYTRSWVSSVNGGFREAYRLPAGKYRFRSSHGSSATTSCHLRGTSTYSKTVTVR